MILTSKDANKLLKKLNEELNSLQSKENRSRTFLASTTEDPEKVRPDYNYETSRDSQTEIEKKIIKLKHAINVFNVNTLVDEFNMTIDEMLIYIPQLTAKKQKLSVMKDTPKLERVTGNARSNIIDYTYTNYDADIVSKDYELVEAELTKAQIALDKVNVTKTFEVDL